MAADFFLYQSILQIQLIEVSALFWKFFKIFETFMMKNWTESKKQLMILDRVELIESFYVYKTPSFFFRHFKNLKNRESLNELNA